MLTITKNLCLLVFVSSFCSSLWADELPLNRDVLSHILSFLSEKEIAIACRTCHAFNNASFEKNVVGKHMPWHADQYLNKLVCFKKKDASWLEAETGDLRAQEGMWVLMGFFINSQADVSGKTITYFSEKSEILQKLILLRLIKKWRDIYLSALTLKGLEWQLSSLLVIDRGILAGIRTQESDMANAYARSILNRIWGKRVFEAWQLAEAELIPLHSIVSQHVHTALGYKREALNRQQGIADLQKEQLLIRLRPVFYLYFLILDFDAHFTLPQEKLAQAIGHSFAGNFPASWYEAFMPTNDKKNSNIYALFLEKSI